MVLSLINYKKEKHPTFNPHSNSNTATYYIDYCFVQEAYKVS